MNLWPKWYRPRLRQPMAADVIAYVAKRRGITREDLFGGCRSALVSHSRHIAFAVLRQRGLSYPVIGRLMGGRDHTSVMHGCVTLPDRMARCPDLQADYEAVIQYARGLA